MYSISFVEDRLKELKRLVDVSFSVSAFVITENDSLLVLIGLFLSTSEMNISTFLVVSYNSKELLTDLIGLWLNYCDYFGYFGCFLDGICGIWTFFAFISFPFSYLSSLEPQQHYKLLPILS